MNAEYHASPRHSSKQAIAPIRGEPARPRLRGVGGSISLSGEAGMQPAMSRRTISAVRSEALFVSALQPSQEPSARQVQQAVAAAIRQFGSRGCARRVAQEFGDHPDAAAARMRWARQAAAEAFARPGVPGFVQGGRRHPACRAA
jgi:hypothetical protein